MLPRILIEENTKTHWTENKQMTYKLYLSS